jgi:hypothetical protein
MNGVVNGPVGDVVSDPRAIFGGIADVDDIAYMEVAERAGMVAANCNDSVFRNGEHLSLGGGVLPGNVNAPQFSLDGGRKSNPKEEYAQKDRAARKSSFHKTYCIRQLYQTFEALAGLR